jgi:hypothetical protein
MTEAAQIEVVKFADYVIGELIRLGIKPSEAVQMAAATTHANAVRVMIESDVTPIPRVLTAAAKFMRDHLGDRATPFDFAYFPLTEWPAVALRSGVTQGIVTYEQVLQLPEDDQIGILPAVLLAAAHKNPASLKGIPADVFEKITRGNLTDEIAELIKVNGKSIEYLPPNLITPEVLLRVVHNGYGSTDLNFLAYLPPEKITPDLIAALNRRANHGKLSGYEAFWSPIYRVISIYGDEGLVAEANLLKSGKIGAKFEVYDHILNGKDRKTEDVKKVTSNALRDLITRLAAVVDKTT